jgi:predicted dehydrogenase
VTDARAQLPFAAGCLGAAFHNDKRQEERIMSDGKVGFAIAGSGMGAVTHAIELPHIPDAELVAISSRNEDTAKEFAETHGAKRYYTDYRRMVEDKDVDVVVIVTPNALHQEYAIAAAEAGKHVVVEKPLETTVERAQKIVDVCRDQGVMLSVIYQMRFCEAAQKIKRAIDDGLFGKMIQCDANDKEYRVPAYYGKDRWNSSMELAGGGCLTLQSTHLVDLMQWFMGPVDKVFAKKQTAVHDMEVEDLVVAMLSFRSGAIGTITSSTCIFPAHKHLLEVNGVNGTAIMNGEYDDLLFWELAGSDEKNDFPPDFKLNDITDPHFYPTLRHRFQLMDIVDAIKTGRPPAITGEEGMKAMILKEAIYKSAALGKEVEVDM